MGSVSTVVINQHFMPTWNVQPFPNLALTAVLRIQTEVNVRLQAALVPPRGRNKINMNCVSLNVNAICCYARVHGEAGSVLPMGLQNARTSPFKQKGNSSKFINQFDFTSLPVPRAARLGE